MFATDVESNANDAYFDSIVGALQDIVIAESFEKMQRSFIEKHVELFENAEDNKPEYQTVFKQYQAEVEAYLAKVPR
jgi:ADP-ribosylation factor 2-binding protein